MRKRPSPSVVIAFVAVLLALGGTATAAKLVTGKQIKNSSITGKDVRNRSLTPSDFRGSVQGPQGIQGPQGNPGVPGPVSMANFTIAQGDAELCGGTEECSIGTAFAPCPPGTKPFSGGVATGALNGTYIGTIAQLEDGTLGWYVAADNYGATEPVDLTAFAYCSPDVKSVTFPNGVIGRKAKQAKAARLAMHRSR